MNSAFRSACCRASPLLSRAGGVIGRGWAALSSAHTSQPCLRQGPGVTCRSRSSIAAMSTPPAATRSSLVVSSSATPVACAATTAAPAANSASAAAAAAIQAAWSATSAASYSLRRLAWLRCDAASLGPVRRLSHMVRRVVGGEGRGGSLRGRRHRRLGRRRSPIGSPAPQASPADHRSASRPLYPHVADHSTLVRGYKQYGYPAIEGAVTGTRRPGSRSAHDNWQSPRSATRCVTYTGAGSRADSVKPPGLLSRQPRPAQGASGGRPGPSATGGGQARGAGVSGAQSEVRPCPRAIERNPVHCPIRSGGGCFGARSSRRPWRRSPRPSLSRRRARGP